jgi:antitoxin component HigA of HigAB toxin-antitoxin module
MQKQRDGTMSMLSERVRKLKELLVMMEREPQKFAQEAICAPHILEKLLPDGCDQAITRDLSPRKQVRATFRFKVLEYITHDILTRDHEGILGSLFLWEMYLNRPEIGQYRSISMKDVADYWSNLDSQIDFMDGPLKQYLVVCGKNELSQSVQKFNGSDKGIPLLLNRIQPNAIQPRDNQVRTLNNYLNAAVERLALDVERATLETLEKTAAETPQIDHPEQVPAKLDVLTILQELMRRKCKDLSPACGIEITDKTAIFKTIESDSGAFRLNWIEAVDLFRNASGVLVSTPHTGRTTYIKMLALKNADTETDCVVVYINAVDLKTYALLKRSVYEFIADQLVQENLAGTESHDVFVADLQHAERNGKIVFFIDDPEALNPEQESEIILQFSLCRQVFFVTTPWAAASVKGLMAEYNPNREIKTYSLGKLTPAEREELVSCLGQQYAGFQDAANKFLAHTYSNLFDQPIGLVALAAEYLRTGGCLSELFTAQRIMNTLMVQAGLDSYKINFNNLSRKSFRLAYLSVILANRTSKNDSKNINEDQQLFWPVYILNEDFSLQPSARDAFIRTFLEPDPNEPRLVRFFFRDLHYLLVAIHYAIQDVWNGRFIGSPKDENSSCIPMEQRSPNLDPNSIVRLYQMELLSYMMCPEVEMESGRKLPGGGS